jgi:hypothetical protein
MNKSTSATERQSGINESQPPATSGHGASASARLRAARLLPPTQTIAAQIQRHNRRAAALVYHATVGNDEQVARLLDDPQAEPVLDRVLDASVREASAAGVEEMDHERWDGMS